MDSLEQTCSLPFFVRGPRRMVPVYVETDLLSQLESQAKIERYDEH
jgi:hypothetical protein